MVATENGDGSHATTDLELVSEKASTSSAVAAPRQRRRAGALRIAKLPNFVRDTVQFFFGGMASMSARGPTLERRNSEDLEGCCLAKILISNLLSLTSRNRRKEPKEAGTAHIKRNDPANGTRRVASTSQVQPRPGVRKTTSSGECVCESIDEQTIERFVALPEGIDRNEWIATHMLGLFDNANALCGTLSELCTPVTCSVMSFPGTSKAPFLDERGKRHTYPAMQYIDCVMIYCEATGKNENIFPTKQGKEFTEQFEVHTKKMSKLLWHCLGHLYSKHWDELEDLSLRPQVGMVIAHLGRLCHHFQLLDPKDQQMINSTIALVRPPRPVCSIHDDFIAGPSIDGRAPRMPSSKSGSWGGYPSPAMLGSKAYAQTC